MELSPRLALVASMINRGDKVADVGTDHGYLPIWLARNQVCSGIIATDIRQQPLNSGKANAEQYGVADKISFRLCSGLAAVKPQEVDTVIICGMGGETIAEILKADPWSRDKTIITQPARSADYLRRWLSGFGLEIIEEHLVRDAGLLYSIIKATKGAVKEPTPGKCYVSPALLRSNDPLLPEYLNRMIKVLEASKTGTAISSKAHDVERNKFFAEALSELEAMKKELEK